MIMMGIRKTLHPHTCIKVAIYLPEICYILEEICYINHAFNSKPGLIEKYILKSQ
jgi:hypothetical protein